jgi:hypothetical protein
VAEVNRLAPLLGLHGITASRNTVRRVPTGGPPTKRGKVPTKVARGTDDGLPFQVVAGFPRDYRCHLGTADRFYRKGRLPF